MAFICENCFYEGRRRSLKPGSKQMEWFLWLVLFFPGPIYSAWRIWGTKHLCPNCNAERSMVRSWTPKGKMLRWEAEDQLVQEIKEMEARKRAEANGEAPPQDDDKSF